MPLLNYTTSVSVDRTLEEIGRILRTHGARQIVIDYQGDGNPVAMAFLVETAFGLRGFRLPANAEAIYGTLNRQKVPLRLKNREQAVRVAWRIVKDWLQAQMAIVESQMVTLDQVFLPYLTEGPNAPTLYEVLVKNQLALPAPREANHDRP